MTTPPRFDLTVKQTPGTAHDRERGLVALTGRTGTNGLDRLAFVLIALVATFVGNEFVADGPPSPWFANEVFGVPLHYPLFAGALLLLSPYIAAAPRLSVAQRLRSVGLWPWMALSWAVLIITITIAIVTGAPELFADWRNFVAVAVTTAAATKWLSSRAWRSWALTDMAVAYGLAGSVFLVRWAIGSGTQLYDVSISVFYGPALFMSIFASVVTLNTWIGGRNLPRAYSWLMRTAAVTSSLVVVLSFRRSFWLGWLLGVAGVVALVLRRRQASPARLLAATMAVVTIAIGAFVATGTEAVVERLASFLPSQDNEYSTTNEDHVNDLLDSLSVIGEEPIFGLGIGRYYQTTLITDWKETSFEVHNTVLHVWLKFGILGVITYLGFHYRWVRGMWLVGAGTLPGDGGSGSRPTDVTVAALTGTAIYLVAQFAATMVGTWPYGSFQMSIHHGLLLAAFLAVAPDVGFGTRGARARDRG